MTISVRTHIVHEHILLPRPARKEVTSEVQVLPRGGRPPHRACSQVWREQLVASGAEYA